MAHITNIVRDRRDVLMSCVRCVRTLVACGMEYTRAVHMVASSYVLSKSELSYLVKLTDTPTEVK